MQLSTNTFLLMVCACLATACGSGGENIPGDSPDETSTAQENAPGAAGEHDDAGPHVSCDDVVLEECEVCDNGECAEPIFDADCSYFWTCPPVLPEGCDPSTDAFNPNDPVQDSDDSRCGENGSPAEDPDTYSPGPGPAPAPGQ